MFKDVGSVIVMIAVLVVVAILMFGIGTYAKGGEFNRKHANRIMRWRVIAQGIAIVIILIVVAIRHARG
jgi:hypothetical protein